MTYGNGKALQRNGASTGLSLPPCSVIMFLGVLKIQQSSEGRGFISADKNGVSFRTSSRWFNWYVNIIYSAGSIYIIVSKDVFVSVILYALKI